MRLGLLVLVLISAASGQRLSAGLKGGIPLTDVFKATGFIGNEPFRASTSRFTIGPMFELRLPFGLGAEFDILYKRFEQTGGAVGGGTATKTGSSFEFPLLGKYRFKRRPLVEPYVEGGVAYNRLSGVLSAFRTLPSPPSSQPEESSTRRGMVLGAGIELKLLVIRVSPGLRYTHWGGKDALPASNAVDFLVGVSF